MSEREFRLEKNKYLKLNIEKQGYYPYNDAILADHDKTEYIYLNKIFQDTAKKVGFGSRINDIATVVGCYRNDDGDLIGYAVLDSIFRTCCQGGYRTNSVATELLNHSHWNDGLAYDSNNFIKCSQDGLFIPLLMSGMMPIKRDGYHSSEDPGAALWDESNNIVFQCYSDRFYDYNFGFVNLKLNNNFPRLPDCAELKIILDNADIIDQLDESNTSFNKFKLNVFKNTLNQRAHTCMFSDDNYYMLNNQGLIEKYDNPNYDLYGWTIPVVEVWATGAYIGKGLDKFTKCYLKYVDGNNEYNYVKGTFIGNIITTDGPYKGRAKSLIILDAEHRSSNMSYGTYNFKKATNVEKTNMSDDDLLFVETIPTESQYTYEFESIENASDLKKHFVIKTCGLSSQFQSSISSYHTPEKWGMMLPYYYAEHSLDDVSKDSWTDKTTKPMIPTTKQLSKIYSKRQELDTYDPTVIYDESDSESSGESEIISDNNLTNWTFNGSNMVASVSVNPIRILNTHISDEYFRAFSTDIDLNENLNNSLIISEEVTQKYYTFTNRINCLTYNEYGVVPIIEFKVDEWDGLLDDEDTNQDSSNNTDGYINGASGDLTQPDDGHGGTGNHQTPENTGVSID